MEGDAGEHSFKLARGRSRRLFVHRQRASASAVVAIAAHVDIDGARYGTHRSEIRYDHIPTQMLEPAARFKALSLDLAFAGVRWLFSPARR